MQGTYCDRPGPTMAKTPYPIVRDIFFWSSSLPLSDQLYFSSNRGWTTTHSCEDSISSSYSELKWSLWTIRISCFLSRKQRFVFDCRSVECYQDGLADQDVSYAYSGPGTHAGWNHRKFFRWGRKRCCLFFVCFVGGRCWVFWFAGWCFLFFW